MMQKHKESMKNGVKAYLMDEVNARKKEIERHEQLI